MTTVNDVMTREAAQVKFEALTGDLDAQQRAALSTLLHCTPEAYDMFVSENVYRALERVRAHAADGHVRLRSGYDVDRFIFQVREKMPSIHRYAPEDED